MLVVGKARLYITGDVRMTGNDTIIIQPNASLEIYIGGAYVTFGGNGIVNNALTADKVTIYGLSTCTQMDFKGTASLTARVVAPYTDVDFHGTSDIYGSLFAKSIDLSGTSDIHYDEALYVNGPPFGIISWEEQ